MTPQERYCVARTAVSAHVLVLTTFGGEDGAFDSRVFGGVLDGEDARYPTQADALAGHAYLVAWCRRGEQGEDDCA